MSAAIQLSNGRGFALVNDWDAPMVREYPWCLANGYDVHNFYNRGNPIVVAMHRFVLGVLPGDPRIVHHVNGDKLDNRRSNLRICLTRLEHTIYHNTKPEDVDRLMLHWGRVDDVPVSGDYEQRLAA